jgi:hypothetical protein
MSLLAVILLSLLSTNTGLANKWSPTPNAPAHDPHSPPGDVVIKYPQGSFIVVKCEEATARYLYFNPSERCIYSIKSTPIYRFLSLISTLLLMGGVIALANARIQDQTAFAGAYMLINIFYWIGAALPPASHWDLSRLEVHQIEVHGGMPPRSAQRMEAKNGTAQPPGKHEVNRPPTYTEALWKAIAVTGTSNWVKEAGWSPKTSAWHDWLNEAEEAAVGEPMKTTYYDTKEGKHQEVWTIRDWDSRRALSTLLRTNTDRFRERTLNGPIDSWRQNLAKQESKEVSYSLACATHSLTQIQHVPRTVKVQIAEPERFTKEPDPI